MASVCSPQLRSPERKIPRKRKHAGKVYLIHLGYGDSGKNLCDEYHCIKERMGFTSIAETTRCDFEKIGPFVEDEELSNYMAIKKCRQRKRSNTAITSSRYKLFPLYFRQLSCVFSLDLLYS